MAVIAQDQLTLQIIQSFTGAVTYYLLQSSALAPPAKPTTSTPPSPWTLTEPAFNPAQTQTLYTVTKNLFGANKFEYGEVQKSSQYEYAKAAYNKALNAENSTAKQVVTEYAEHTNPDTPPTQASSVWSTTKPPFVSGVYIWIRFKFISGDNTVTYSNPANISGIPGDSIKDILPLYKKVVKGSPMPTKPTKFLGNIYPDPHLRRTYPSWTTDNIGIVTSGSGVQKGSYTPLDHIPIEQNVEYRLSVTRETISGPGTGDAVMHGQYSTDSSPPTSYKNAFPGSGRVNYLASDGRFEFLINSNVANVKWANFGFHVQADMTSATTVRLSDVIFREYGGWETVFPSYEENTEVYTTYLYSYESGRYEYSEVQWSTAYEGLAVANNAIFLANVAQASSEGLISVGEFPPDHGVGKLWIKTETFTHEPDVVEAAGPNPILDTGLSIICGLGFTVSSTIDFISTTVYALAAGTKTFTIYNRSNGSVVATITKDLALGPNVLKWNQALAPGNYNILALAGGPSLIRNAGGSVYPYITGAFSITGQIQSATETPKIGSYYFFYEIQLGRTGVTQTVERMTGMYQSVDGQWLEYAMITGLFIVPNANGPATIIDQNGAYIGQLAAESISSVDIQTESVLARHIAAGEIEKRHLDSDVGGTIEDAELWAKRVDISPSQIVISQGIAGQTVDTSLTLKSTQLSFTVQGNVIAYMDSTQNVMGIGNAVIDQSLKVGNHLITKVVGSNDMTIVRYAN